MNPNTVVRAYRELEHKGCWLKTRLRSLYQSDGGRARLLHEAQKVMHSAVERLIFEVLATTNYDECLKTSWHRPAQERKEGAVVDKP